MAKKIAGVARDEANAIVSGASTSLRREIDNFAIAAGTTDGAGKFSWDDDVVDYPGPVRWIVTDGAGVSRTVSGSSVGQAGTMFVSDLRRAFRMMTDGVFKNVGSDLAVSAAGATMKVTIAPGMAFLFGHPYYQGINRDVAIASNGSGNPRIDLIALRIYPPGVSEEGRIDRVSILGTPSATPVAPGLTNSEATYWEIPLAKVQVDPGVTSIAGGKVTDFRTYTAGPLLDGSITTAKIADLAATREKISMNAIILNRMDAEGNLSTSAIAKVYKAPVSGNTPTIAALGLSELADVDETVPTDGQVVTWDSASSKYKPKALPSSVLVVVQEGDTTKVTALTTLDFDASDFDVTETPAGEANVALAYGTGAGSPAEGNHTHAFVYAAFTHTHVLSALVDVTATASEVNVLDGVTATTAELNYTDGVTSAIQTQIDTKSDITHYNGEVRFGTPVTASNSSAATYVTLLSETFTLPTGTWSLSCGADSLVRTDTANDGATLRFESPVLRGGISHNAKTADMLYCIPHGELFTGQSGTVTITVKYKARTAGTVTAERWKLTVIANRTS